MFFREKTNVRSTRKVSIRHATHGLELGSVESNVTAQVSNSSPSADVHVTLS